MNPRKLAFRAAAPAFALVAVAALWLVVRPAYRHYQENRAVRHAESSWERGDFPNASISARQALTLNPRNLRACEVMARLSAVAGSPQLLGWEARIAELAPTPENQLRLAAAALAFEQPPCVVAGQVLETMSDDTKARAPWHLLSAQLALKRNQLEVAEAHFGAAAKLEPTNPLPQLNLAALRLNSSNDTVAAQARATLISLRSNANLAPIALRWLIVDGLRRERLTEARAFSQELLALPRATLEDRLQELEILKQASSPDFLPVLNTLQEANRTNTAAVYAVCAWMNQAGLGSNALQWLGALPPQFRAQQSIQLATAECHAALKHWSEMEQFLDPLRWDSLEFLRRALLSQAAAGQANKVAEEAHWRLAVRLAGNRPGPLQALLKLAERWDRQSAREELLWRIARSFPRERWPLAALNQLYTSAGDTAGLHKVAAELVARNGNDFVAQNNLAATALLLHFDESRAHALAARLYQQHPTEPIIVSTFAYSLHLQGRTREGLQAMEKLSPAQLETPAVALYYGALLRATGDTNKAGHFLGLAKDAALLPEERQLLARQENVF